MVGEEKRDIYFQKEIGFQKMDVLTSNYGIFTDFMINLNMINYFYISFESNQNNHDS